MGSRKSRDPGAASALAVVSAAAALLLAACGGTAATPAPSGASAEPPPTASAEPTAVPSAVSDYDSAAAAIIAALGGEVPAGATAAITYGDTSDGSPSVHVALGDWQLAWDSGGVLRHVFWEQFNSGETLPPSAIMTETQIRDRVDGFVAALGLTIGPPKEFAAQEGTWMAAWMAAWPRLVDGVPVEENGTRIWVNGDGTFLQYSYAWNPLAGKPATVITDAQAIQAAEPCEGKAGTCEATLVWHLPGTAPADAPMSLCWIVGPKGGNGDWRVWVDAGSGEVVDVAAQLG
jgi:hypothetical protein